MLGTGAISAKHPGRPGRPGPCRLRRPGNRSRPCCTRRAFLGTASLGAIAAVRSGSVAAEPATEPAGKWRPRWILASALYGTFPLAEILPEVAKTGADLIDLWPKPHGTQREEIDTLGEAKVKAMLAAAGVRLGGIACYKVGAFKLADEFALAKRLGGEGTVLVTTAPGDGSLSGDALTAALEAFLEKLAPSIAAAEATGGVIAIENHSSSPRTTAWASPSPRITSRKTPRSSPHLPATSGRK